MDLELFIHRNVNMYRGGYRPHEVADLIRQAWKHAKREQLSQAVLEAQDKYAGLSRAANMLSRGF